MNPIINQMMSTMVGNNPLVQLFRSIKGAQNKDAMLQAAAQKNPQLGQVLSFINKNGGDAKQLYYAMCQQQNKDPNIIINQLNNM